MASVVPTVAERHGGCFVFVFSCDELRSLKGL